MSYGLSPIKAFLLSSAFFSSWDFPQADKLRINNEVNSTADNFLSILMNPD